MVKWLHRLGVAIIMLAPIMVFATWYAVFMSFTLGLGIWIHTDTFLRRK